jgi:hypothetical protein
MMQDVLLTRDFKCCPGGVYVETFKEGEIVTGFVAAVALRQGAGMPVRAVPFNPVQEVKTEAKRGRK